MYPRGGLVGETGEERLGVDLLDPSGAVEPDDVRWMIRCGDRFWGWLVGLSDVPLATDMTGCFVLDPVEDLADVHGVGTVVQERGDGDDRGDAEHDRDGDRKVRDDDILARLTRRSH